MARCKCILPFLICCSFAGLAQPVLHGRVTNFETNQPVFLANVFLSNTSIGGLTAANGEFILKTPKGRYDLVVSFIGYETYTVQIESAHLPATLEIILKPKVNELKEVIVESYEKHGWEKWGNIFLENFLGTSAFVDGCKLLNKEALRFRYHKKSTAVFVIADEPLIIENHALGYVLTYSLVRFEFNLSTHEFFFKGYPFFEEMQTKRKGVQKTWKTNREKAYYGSLMHFMRSLYRKKLTEEQFEVRKLLSVTEQEIRHVKDLYLQYKNHANKSGDAVQNEKKSEIVNQTGFNNPDSADYYRAVWEQSDRQVIILKKPVPGDSLMSVKTDGSTELRFTGHLQIRYKPLKNPVAYQKYITREAYYLPVTSELYRTTDKPVFVLANGSFFEGSNLITSGYWAWWEKMCNKLPYDYWPAPKTKTPVNTRGLTQFTYHIIKQSATHLHN